MRGKYALPDDIYHVDIDIGTFRRPVLLKLLQRGRSVIGPADVFDFVAGLLRPLFSRGSFQRPPSPTSESTGIPNCSASTENGRREEGHQEQGTNPWNKSPQRRSKRICREEFRAGSAWEENGGTRRGVYREQGQDSEKTSLRQENYSRRKKLRSFPAANQRLWEKRCLAYHLDSILTNRFDADCPGRPIRQYNSRTISVSVG